MYPTTTTGRALTIVYAIIGIPLFLIVLTDFGKLFTRAIKFLWAFVRRLYFTGTCKQARKVTAVQVGNNLHYLPIFMDYGNQYIYVNYQTNRKPYFPEDKIYLKAYFIYYFSS